MRRAPFLLVLSMAACFGPPRAPDDDWSRPEPDAEELAAVRRAAEEEIGECAGATGPTGAAFATVVFGSEGRVREAECKGIEIQGGKSDACCVRVLHDIRVAPFRFPQSTLAFDVAVGRLPPELASPGPDPDKAVRRVVQERSGVFQACFQKGVERDPGLHGGVSVRFAIGRDGRVTHASIVGSDLPDVAVRSCMRKGFEGLVFPPPEGGPKVVTYPMVFAPAPR